MTNLTDQQTKLLQKDEGWIVWTAGDDDPNLEAGTLVERVLFNGAGYYFSSACSFKYGYPWYRDPKVVAYRLTNNDRYKDGVRVILQQGDYCTESMDEETYTKVCQAFINAGANGNEAFRYYYWTSYGNVGWNDDVGVHHWSNGISFTGRNLTAAQIISATNAGSESFKGCEIVQLGNEAEEHYDGGVPVPVKWSGEGLPPVGVTCEVTWREAYNRTKTDNLTVKGFHGSGVWFGDENINIVRNSDLVTFRPIQSDREKFVEAATKSLKGTGWDEQWVGSMVSKLYDAGFRAPSKEETK